MAGRERERRKLGGTRLKINRRDTSGEDFGGSWVFAVCLSYCNFRKRGPVNRGIGDRVEACEIRRETRGSIYALLLDSLGARAVRDFPLTIFTDSGLSAKGENAEPAKPHSYRTIYCGLPVVIYGPARACVGRSVEPFRPN